MDYLMMRFPDFRKKALTLSYDDGVIFDRELIEIMQKNGLKGTFNINSGLFSAKSGDSTRLTESEAYELYADSGMEVAVHGVKHLSLAVVPEGTAMNDVINDRVALEKLFSRQVRGMAYANGSYNDNVVENLRKCGIVYSRTVISTERFDIPEDWLRLPATCHHNNPKLMSLADEFLSDTSNSYYWSKFNGPKLFYLWGHSYEFNNNNNWDVIEKFAEKTGGRDDVWYATNMEIYEYVTAFKNLVFSVDMSIVYNPTATGVWLNLFGKDVFVGAGQTIKV